MKKPEHGRFASACLPKTLTTEGQAPKTNVLLSKIALQMLKDEQAKKKEMLNTKKIEKYLVLDLDETLVHSCSSLPEYPAKEIEVYTSYESHVYYVISRPGLLDFLEKMKTCYNIIIYTSSQKEYAETVIETAGIKKYVTKLYHRSDCRRIHQGIYLKEISKLSLPLKDVVFIDDAAPQIEPQKHNGLEITPFHGDAKDTELSRITPFLQKLAEVDDVRSVSQRWKEFTSGKEKASMEFKTSSARDNLFVRKMKHSLFRGVTQKDLPEEDISQGGDDEETTRLPIMQLYPSNFSRQSTGLYPSVLLNDTSSLVLNTSPSDKSAYFLSGDTYHYQKKIEKYKKASTQLFSSRVNVSGDLGPMDDDGDISIMPVMSSLVKKRLRS